MRSKLNDLVALAGGIHVREHKRTSVKGKVFDVQAYLRQLRGLSLTELSEEAKALSASLKTQKPGSIESRQTKSRLTFAERRTYNISDAEVTRKLAMHALFGLSL